jgi:uncharacterized membrane protein YuzA (DUF378 family)
VVGAFALNRGAILQGEITPASRAVTVIVGLCALWRITPFLRSFSIDEPAAELGRFWRG